MNRQQQQQQMQQQQSQQQVVQQTSYQTQQQTQQVVQQQQRISRVEQHVTRQVTSQQQVQGMVMQSPGMQMIGGGRPGDASPPVFEQIFKNARFAQGGNALFEGRVRGNPKPVVSWTRKGAPLFESNKYKMQYEEQTGNVSLLINQIGPGDEGEYTCSARNQYGEAICSVYIQPEGQPQLGGYQRQIEQSYESSEQRTSGGQTVQSYQQQRTEKTSYSNGHTLVQEDFKVDTFEYRLLREVEYRESVTRRYSHETDARLSTVVDRALGPAAAPQISQKPRNSKLSEGSDAVFAAKVPANPKPRLTWFKNGVRIVPSQKFQSSYSNQQATLKVTNAQTDDSGHYTLLAENPQGCVVSSAYLAIEPQAQESVYQREISSTRSTHQETQQVVESSEVDASKMLAPNFVRVCSDRDVTEGKMTRFDCRVTGRPYPEVAWYINGRQVCDDATHKILVNESGNHALMITNVSRADAGVVACVARNKAGETSFQCNLSVIEKELVVAPKFVERFTTVTVNEGEPVVLNARAVGTPCPRITWQKDGIPISSSPDVQISVDGGASTLDIPRARTSDAAWYQCTAQNVAGSTATRARLYVIGPDRSQQTEARRLHLPRPTRVIEPEPEPGPEVIYLRHVERAKPHLPAAEPDRQYPPPQFIVPLRDVAQAEGGRIHLEARIEPVGDPTMQVEWFLNGRLLAASSRATTTFRFGFIALDLLSIIVQDGGEYVCRATSSTGVAESRARLTVTARTGIEQSSQHPDSLQQIQQLEDYSRYQRTESVEDVAAQRPEFIRPLHDLGELHEGRNAHFEAQLTPVSDPTMKVEWYKDGRPITASSRITSIFNFGYVSLNILHLRAEDSGVYTVRALNRWGEAISSSTVRVIARTTVTGDLGIPEQQRYIEKTEELEAYHQAQQYRSYQPEQQESYAPPEFKTPIKDQLGIRENAFAHFEARLEPVGDPTLRVEWFKDGRPVEASSRITSFFNFGYVALTIKNVTSFDQGTYTCRAVNQLGEAVTSAQLTVQGRTDIIMESQHPGGLEKIQYLEDNSRYARMQQEESQVTKKPMFLGPLKGTTKIVEGQRAHFEARVEPMSDTTLSIEWYHNGKAIQHANRIQLYHDFGYVALDILSVRSEDSGTYTVVARNALGEAQQSASMVVETRSGIDTSSMHHGTFEKTRQMEDSKFVEPHYNVEEYSKSKPVFVQPLSDPKPVSEGKNIHLECRLEPMGDPTMRVEWFQNGRPVTVGSRFRTYYDFGYVALDIVKTTAMDSGEYTCRATNHLGSAHTSACVRVISRADIVTDTMNESSLEQIQMLESRHQRQAQEEIIVAQPPQFTRPLHNLETIEGTNVHLECRLQPVGDPTMRVEWFVNGRPVRTGHRFRPAYDFDYVALDLLSVYPEDSGVYTCQARNQLGEAVTSCSVRVIAKKDLLLETQHPGGLEKIQYLEDSSRYKKTEMADEIVNVRPRFITRPKNVEGLREGSHAHFECKLEPVTDPNLKVEWFKNGRPITVGHRFRPIHDFGYVALDIIDLIAEDSATYTCRAVNLVGSDETTCTLSCRGSAQIVTTTENEQGLQQIQYLEDRSRFQRHEQVDESTTQAPVFTTSLKPVNIKEGQRAHFECRLIPVSDATMKVEWFHNGQPLKSGSRFTETNNFGFVALDILYCYPEDAGTYTCRARNILGEAVTSTTLAVQSRQSIQRDTQHESALGRINQLEGTRHQRADVPDDAVTQAPVFTQPMRDVRVAENQAAHFEARLIPVGDPKLRVEWLRNGVPIQASNRVTTMHDFGYVAFNMKYVNPEDSGTYTCRAINELGQAFTSAALDVASKASLLLETQHHGAVEKIQQLEDHTRYGRREEQDVVVTQAPHFTTQLNGPTQLVEGQSAHYECRIEPYPDPNLKVEWFHNGKPLSTGHRYRTTYDFGFASLDVLTVYAEDAGEYTCRASNQLGQAQSSIKLGVTSRAGIIRETQHEGALQKIQHLEDDSRYRRKVDEDAVVMEKPQFGRSLRNIENLPEGQSAHLEATLTPVNDPTMVVEWFCNGRPIKQGHRFKTTYDFGFVALDVLYAYPEDSGTYMCRARNAVGEAVTTCSVKVLGKEGLCLDTLDEQRLQKIRELENYARPQREEIEAEAQKPVFVTPLASLPNLKEGEHAHLECRVEPINDPNLRIDWFVNGKPLKAGHRFRTTHDFGYVALDILYAYAEDSGTYMCKATNLQGEAVNTCEIGCASRRSIYLESQHPDGLEKIQMLEAAGHPARLEVEEPTVTAPRLVTELRGTTEICEGQTAHFECQVEPMHDPNLRIDFYHNGKPLPSGNRFHITFDFGYVALDITHAVAEDAGEYSVRVTNALGECQSSIKLKVVSKGSIILESQRPEALEKISKLEAGAPKRAEAEEPQTRQRPVFTQPLQNIDNIAEGQTAHFECRLIPVGDPTLKVEWFRNEKPLETSSRIAKTHDFGFVSLDMSHVREEDEGVYMCRATNALGEAVTTASMKIRSKASIQLDTLHPEGMKRVQQLEEGKGPQRPDEPERVFEKPIFTQMLTGPSELWEGQHAHFECRVVPVGDPNLRFEWFVNGVELKMGSRFRVTHDFGFVTLDISKTIPEDSGVYMCKAINLAGEAVSSTSLKVKSKSSIASDALQPDAWQKIQLKEAEMNRVPDMFVDTTPQQAPVFTTHLNSQDKLIEGQHVYLEAQVEPRADPNLRVEWFKNGESLTTGSRIRSTFDFGLVTLSINGLRADDSAIYTCKATNLLGEAVSTATLKIDDQHWLINQPLHPEAIPRIEQLEAPKEARPDAPEPTYELPVFITHLNNVECKEGDTVHFECHVEPAKDPTLGIEWFVNGKPLTHGARFKSTYDFGYVSLDISGAYPEDSGIYTCKATNSKGSATTSGSLRCTGKSSIYLDTQHPQGKQGLDAVDEVEAAVQGKSSRQPDKPEPQFPKPIWTVPLQPEFRLGENDKLHLEGTVEPKEDPNLKIEWYFNGKALEHGSRFKMTNDFGFVTLDLADVYERDQGVYTCKAYNQAGEAFTSTTIYCTGKENLIEGTQHPKGEKGLEQIQNLEDALTRAPGAAPDAEGGQPPVFTSQLEVSPELTVEFQNLSNLSEGDIAHFEASLTPVGDQTMVVEWFYNGKQLEASHRTRTVHAFGMVVLEILGTKIEDSGTYTCRATNKWGQAEISVNLECVDKSKGQKPQFTSQIQSLDGLKEGDSAHFECTLIPVNDPNLKVEWFHNGQPLRHSSRIKSVSDFGFVVMDIAYVQSHDTGEYICKASNRYGEDTTRATIKCTGKGGVYLDSLQPDALARIRELESSGSQQPSQSAAPADQPPKFITQISDVVNLKEGQSAHFEARLTPVNDPNLVVEWYYNGKKLPHGHRYRTFHDFGIVILDILYCYEENSGLYECRAYNKVGEDSTKANLKCVSKANLILESQLPQGMEGGLEKIQTLEDSLVRTRDEQSTDLKGVAPVFTVPLANIDNLREGESCHFEARLTPTNDPKLKVEWFWNGKPLKTGSRFRTFCDFGFVILEISPVYPEDSGEYSCRASNDYGEAVTTATMKIQGKRSIIMESQLPQGMEGTIDKIAELEGLGQPRGPTEVEDDTGKPPEFVTNPVDQSLPENSLAHFECRLIPVNDPSMRVEWFHNGKALWAGSRIKTINDFGFVILEVAGIYVRDAGLYTCKATNKHGEATVSCKLQVRGRQGIVLEPQLPAHFKTGTESIQKLEEQLYKKDEIMAEDEKPNPPRFIVELKDQTDLEEGQPAHFDCRVEPASDPTMRIDWFWNGRPFATGSRVHQLNDFGFIVMDLMHTYARDSGEFMCRATNKWGTATTKATLQCRPRKMIDFDSQLPQGMSGEKLKALERGPLPTAAAPEEPDAQPPKFVTQITSAVVEESESVHFECRVEPKNDPKLRIEWYRKGKPLPSGHRYRSTYDMGFVSLDILSVYNEDEGEYVCRAVNDVGEDFTKATISCKKLPTIVLHNQVPKGMLKSEQLMQMEAAIKKYTSEIHLTEDDLFDPERKQPPRFVTQIQTQMDLVEMQNTKFECQLAPVGDPNMKVEWFFNGKPLPYKNRFTPIYDFGYVAMNFGWVYPEDSGEYLCRATNLYGMDETRAVIKTAGKPGIIYESQLPKGMKSIERIREMEAAWQVVPESLEEEDKARAAPIFVTKPDPFTVEEGECARFCCRVTGHPRPRVMWLVNGHTVVNGSRYKLTYDGMWHLDIPKTRQYDNGTVEVIARNSVGEARVSTELVVKPRGDDYRSVLKNSPRRILGTKEYRKPEWVTQMEELKDALKAVQAVPSIEVELRDTYVEELDTVVFECVYSGTPKPDIIWYHDDQIVRNTEKVKITIEESKTTCTVKYTNPEDAGIYVCKATSDIGMAITKAKLSVTELDEEKKSDKMIQIAQEEEEKIKMEQVKLDKKKEKKKRRPRWGFTEGRDHVSVDEVQVMESTDTYVETVDSATAQRRQSIQDSVAISAIASCKKVDEPKPAEKPKDRAQPVLPEREGVSISEAIPDHAASDMVADKKPKLRKAKLSESERLEEAKITVVKVQEIIRTQKVRMAKEVEDIMDLMNAREFGPGESPLRELAEIGFLVRHGVSVRDIESVYHETDQFPALRTPAAQSALVSLVEREGHGTLISQVLTEETTADETTVAKTVGFRAFMRMIELRHVTVEEVLTHFNPQDFQTPVWETTEASKVETTQLSTVKVTQRTKVHTGEDQKEIVKKRTTRREDEIEEDVSLSITKETEILKEETEVVLADGDLVYSICTYVAENEDAMNLVEGERVYILESHNSDWWFVRKTLTAEKGWVPAKILKDEVTYTHHLTHTLHEKIDKLPVFEKPAPGETASAPRFVEKLQPQHAPDGATVQLECRVEGNPKPQITWFRETAIIKPSADFQMYYDEDNVATLIIREVFPEDAGFFTCVAKNNVGFASSTTELYVEHPLSDHGSDITAPSRKSMSRESSLADILEGIPPTFSRKPKAKCVPVGEDVDLECRLVAIPEPEVTWFFNGKEITTEKNVTVSMDSDMHSYSSVVRISKITRTQEGTYTVVAKNREGEASMTITVKVQTGEKEAPQILEPLKSVTIREGDSAVLSTQIVGNPKPKVSWHKDGKAAPKLPTKADGDTYTLTLIQPKASDSAQYTVKAANEVGKCETSATLTVEELPRPEPPLFVERFQELKVKEKSTIKLVAKVTGNPTPQITWFKNNEPLQPSPRVKETFDGSVVTLQVTGADSELDSGDYKCLASNPSGKASHGARVTVDVDKVTFTRKLQKSVTVDEHSSIKLECETSHTVSTKWYHNGKELSGMDHREIVQENRVHRLVIKRTKALDAGTYACKVKDQSTECTVSVSESKAEFVRKVEDIEVTEREVAILEVEVSSDTAEVTWHKDGEQLKETKEKVVFERKGGVRRLLIRSTSVHDEGEYTCSLGDQECSAEVTVIELPPEIITKLKDTTVPEGDKATFEIELTKGDALVKWFKDGKELQFSEHIQLAIDGKRQKLKIYNAELSDAGVFSCQVGDQTSKATLTVTAIPTTKSKKEPGSSEKDAPTIEIDESSLYQRLVVKEQWKVKAKFTGHPKPEVSWSKSERKISSDKTTVIHTDESTSTITIQNVLREDSAKYTITVTNSAGSANKDVELKVVDKPGKPQGPMGLKDVDSQSVTITWKPPVDDGGLELSKYSIEKCETKQMVWSKVADVEKDVQLYCVQKLQEDSEYMFRVFAQNPVGQSEPLESPPVTPRSSFDKPSAPRGPFEISSMTETSFTLKWQPPESDGGSPILEYLLERREAGKKAWQKVGTTSGDTAFINVPGLKANTPYNFRVTASNIVGSGPPYAPEEPITAGKMITSPSAPTNLTVIDVTSRSVTLQWGPPENLGGTDLTGYIVERLDAGSQKWVKIATLEPNCTQYCCENLKEKSEFTFRVLAENSVGLSPPASTDRIQLKTHATPPSPPTAPLEILAVGPYAVVIEWGIPESDGGSPLTGYTIAIRDTRKTMWMEVGRVKADVQKLNIKDLQENHEYLIRIFAVNEVGSSEPLESEEPFKVLKPSDLDAADYERAEATDKDTPSVSFSTETTTSWMREHNMDADIETYAKGSLLQKDEYFFKIWCYAKKLFK